MDLLAWMPHEERIGGVWQERRGGVARRRGADGASSFTPTPGDQVAYFRAQLKLLAHLCFGRNLKAAETIVELVPLEMLLVLIQPPPPTDPDAPLRRLLPRDRHLVCEIILWLYLDSPRLDARKPSLISRLHLWTPPPPPPTEAERRRLIDQLICSPASQLTQLELDATSPYARPEEVGIPVWVRPRGAPPKPPPRRRSTPATASGGAHACAGLQRGASSASSIRGAGPTLVGGVEIGGGGGVELMEADATVAAAVASPPAAAATDEDVLLEKGVLVLDDAHVASQQERLLDFVLRAINAHDTLVYLEYAPPAQATEAQQRRMADEKERFRYNLSVFRMMRVMAEAGMFRTGSYMPPPVGGASSSTAAAKPPDHASHQRKVAFSPSDPGSGKSGQTSRWGRGRGGGGGGSGGGGSERGSTSSLFSSASAEVTDVLRPLRRIEASLVAVMRRSEPRAFLHRNLDASASTDPVALLDTFHRRTTEADELLIDAKVEICKVLQIVHDMYTDARLDALLGCYKRLYITHVERRLWRGKDEFGNRKQLYEDTVNFDRPDTERELPPDLRAQYVGLDADFSYAHVFERLCYRALLPLLNKSNDL